MMPTRDEAIEGTEEALDETLLALAHPARRAILQQLARGDARVTDLAEPFAMSLNSVSKHIRLLERAKLVRRRQVGREHFLRFDPAPLAAAQAWIKKQQNYWGAHLRALDAFLQNDGDAPAEEREP